MSLKDLVDNANTKSAFQALWSPSPSAALGLKNTTKQSEMHSDNSGTAGKGYSLSGDPTKNALPKNQYFRYQTNKTVSVPNPSTIDSNSGVSTTYTTHYPGNGQLGTGRYSQNAPEGKNPGGL